MLSLAAAPGLLENLRHIIDRTDAKIVLSSTWRTEEITCLAVRRRLRSVGLEVFGCTQQLSDLEPGPVHCVLCEDAGGHFSPEQERVAEIRSSPPATARRCVWTVLVPQDPPTADLLQK